MFVLAFTNFDWFICNICNIVTSVCEVLELQLKTSKVSCNQSII